MTWLGALCQIKRAQTKLNTCLNLHSGPRCPDILAASFQAEFRNRCCVSFPTRGCAAAFVQGGWGVGQRVYVICRRGSSAACVTFSYGHLCVSTRKIYFGLRQTWSYDIKMMSACVCVVFKWFRRLRESVGGSKSWWVPCRTHWGLSETFQTSTDEKGVAAGWRALKMRVFICSWMKLKYPWQELRCCYYCLISLSLGGISGSLPDSGWSQPSLSYEFTG